MNTKIYKVLCAGVVAVSLSACSDDFLEVQNPTGEPLEEYYMPRTVQTRQLQLAQGL